jgi:hypothetical protein
MKGTPIAAENIKIGDVVWFDCGDDSPDNNVGQVIDIAERHFILIHTTDALHEHQDGDEYIWDMFQVIPKKYFTLEKTKLMASREAGESLYGTVVRYYKEFQEG